MQGAYIGGVDLSDLHVRCASTQIALPKAHCLKTFTQRGIWLNELPDMVEPRMGLMVLPDSRQMLRYGDSALLHLRLIADAGLHHWPDPDRLIRAICTRVVGPPLCELRAE